MSPGRRQEVTTARLEPAKPPDNHNAMSAERSRHGQPVEAGPATYYSASPSSCKALESTTLTPARELDRRTTRYLLCCTCHLH
jgi:hypothetical protein